METSITTLIIDLVICSSLFYSISRKKGHAYTFWMLLAIGSLFYFIGDTIVIYQRLALHEYKTFVDPSDIFYLLFLLFYTLAFFYKFMHDCKNWKRIFVLCDICIIITAIFTLNYYLFIKNAVNQTEISIISEFVQLAYPVANLLFLLIGVCLLLRLVTITSKLVISLLSCSLILYALVDSAYAYIKYFLPHGSTFTVAPLYQVILGIVAIACLLHTNEQNKYVQVLFTIQMGEKIRLSIPYLSVAALIIFTLYENTFSPILVKGVFLTFFFVLIRHMLVRNQNKKLLQKQQQFNLELEKQIELRTEDLVNQTNALFQSQQMFKSLYEHHPDPIFTLDLHGKFLNINNAGITLLGYQADEILNKPYHSLVYEEDLETVVDVFRYVKKGHSAALDIRAYHQNRDIYYLHVTVVPIIFKEQIMGIYVMVKDITESKKQQEQINFLAYHDTLTHLANRRAFEEQLDNAIIQAGKDETQFAIMFLDLDRFKIINDTLGHKMGDFLLVEVAKRLQCTVGQNGKVARFAGDEFTVLIEKYNNFSEVETIANNILQVMKEPIQIENHTLQITPSIGISTYPDAGDDAISLLQHADMAMYEAKNKGKNGISIYR
ncbi:sensor domain-containing diguanylate cyclase [Bacillus rhizoplanae]